MYVAEVRLVNFRSYRDAAASFGPGLNVVVGENAAGKTNLLEAIAVLGNLRSFRSGGARRLVRHGVAEFTLEGEARVERAPADVERAEAAYRAFYDDEYRPLYGDREARVLNTTVGRVFFAEVWPEQIGFVNKLVDKGMLGDMIWHCHKLAGHDRTVQALCGPFP